MRLSARLIMLAAVLGHFTERRIGRRVLLAVAAVPIAIVANAARVAGTGLMSELVSPVAAEGFLHTFSGWLLFVVAFIGLVAVQRALAGPVADPPASAGIQPREVQV